MGLIGYVPKRIDCKAKTADRNSMKGSWQLAGLVVDYRIHSDVFKPEKTASAKKAWGEFESVVLKNPWISIRNRPQYSIQTLRLCNAQREVHL
jgi:hypothetical protein